MKARAREIVRVALSAVGIVLCRDSSCIFGPPSGMATNGGCRCFERDGKAFERHSRIKLAAVICALAARVAELES